MSRDTAMIVTQVSYALVLVILLAALWYLRRDIQQQIRRVSANLMPRLIAAEKAAEYWRARARRAERIHLEGSVRQARPDPHVVATISAAERTAEMTRVAEGVREAEGGRP